MNRTLQNCLSLLLILLLLSPCFLAENYKQASNTFFWIWVIIVVVCELLRESDRVSNPTSSTASRTSPPPRREMPRQPRRNRKRSQKSTVRKTIPKEQDIVIEKKTTGRVITCPVCSTTINEEDVVHCVRCLTVHHHECFEYFGECATYGCGMYRCKEGFPEAAQSSPRAKRTWVARMRRDVFGNVETTLVPEALDESRTEAQRPKRKQAQSVCQQPSYREAVENVENTENVRTTAGQLRINLGSPMPSRFFSTFQEEANTDDDPGWIDSLPQLLYLVCKVLIVSAANAVLDYLDFDRQQGWRQTSTVLSILIVALPFLLLFLLLNYPQVWLLSTVVCELTLVTAKLVMAADLI